MSKVLYFVDTETTGIDDARLVELTYNGVTVRCKPSKPIETGASAINHISNEDVAHLPEFWEMLEYPTIKEVLENGVIVAHNAQFDTSVLKREGINVTKALCTKEMCQQLYPGLPSYSLQFLRYHFSLRDCGDAHSSYGDVQTLRALWRRMNDDHTIKIG